MNTPPESPEHSFSSPEIARSQPSRATTLALFTLLAVAQACGTTPSAEDEGDNEPAVAVVDGDPEPPKQDPVVPEQGGDTAEGSGQQDFPTFSFPDINPIEGFGDDRDDINLGGLNPEDPANNPTLNEGYTLHCQTYTPLFDGVEPNAVRVPELRFGWCMPPDSSTDIEATNTAIILVGDDEARHVFAELVTTNPEHFTQRYRPEGHPGYIIFVVQSRLSAIAPDELTPEAVDGVELRLSTEIPAYTGLEGVEQIVLRFERPFDPNYPNVQVEAALVPFHADHADCPDTQGFEGICEYREDGEALEEFVIITTTGQEYLAGVFRTILDEDGRVIISPEELRHIGQTFITDDGIYEQYIYPDSTPFTQGIEDEQK